jgi:hypothetical protein
MGGGKSYTTQKTIEQYAQAHPNRTVLIFDPNFEDTYAQYPTVNFDILEIQEARANEKKHNTRIVTKSEKLLGSLSPGIKRIIPYTKFKQQMTQPQMLLTMITICQNFRGGLALFEDINRYTISFEKTEIQSSFKAIRHNSADCIMHLQSLNPLRPIHYESTRVIRMHYDGVSLEKIKNKVANFYTILRIAQLAIDAYYNKAMELERLNPNWESDPKLKEKILSYKRFYLYVFLKDRYIKGITKAEFIKACNEFLDENPSEYRTDLTKATQNNKSKSFNKVVIENGKPTLIKVVESTKVSNTQIAKMNWIKRHLYLFRQQ